MIPGPIGFLIVLLCFTVANFIGYAAATSPRAWLFLLQTSWVLPAAVLTLFYRIGMWPGETAGPMMVCAWIYGLTLILRAGDAPADPELHKRWRDGDDA